MARLRDPDRNAILERFPNLICATCRHTGLESIDGGILCHSCGARYALIDGQFANFIPAGEVVSQEEILVQDQSAVHYEKSRYGNPWSKAYHQWWTDLMILAVNVDGRILDNGCGIGALYDRLPDADITGLDISKEMVRLAGGRSDQVLIGDSQHLPFADASFDTVFARSLIHHLPDPDRGLSEMARVLRPGGEIVTIDTNRTLLSAWPRAVFHQGERFSEEHKNLHRKELLSAFQKYFQVERVRYFGYVAYPIIGFPDIKDLFRYFPAKALSYRILTTLDELLARMPLVKTQSWGILVKGRKTT